MHCYLGAYVGRQEFIGTWVVGKWTLSMPKYSAGFELQGKLELLQPKLAGRAAAESPNAATSLTLPDSLAMPNLHKSRHGVTKPSSDPNSDKNCAQL